MTAPLVLPPPPMVTLSSRWTPMRAHAVQQAYYTSTRRFNVTPAGRRSGKTEIAKRRLVRRAVRGSKYDHPRYFFGAPTRDQAKRISWTDLKRLVPPEACRGRPSEGELVIPLWHGGEICVVGLDKPERIEGSPWDGGVLDEYANMKSKAWKENVRPALSDREGWCDLIGVPEGRNHYYDTAVEAEAAMLADSLEWGYFHWISADILPATEIAAAKRDLDPLTYQQEYEASFVTFAGRVYYSFTERNKRPLAERYDPKQPLLVCLDFNVQPGVAVIAQELPLPLPGNPVGTAVLGEVWIDNNSNTELVCRKVLTDWQPRHAGRIEVFGDATGGARGTAKVEGSDWDIAKRVLRAGDPARDVKGFGDRVSFQVKPANPAERARVNAVNSRTCSTDGTIRLMVDPQAAPHLVKDLEGVVVVKGGSGEIDKRSNPILTHISDALGYYVDFRFPIAERGVWGTSPHAL